MRHTVALQAGSAKNKKGDGGASSSVPFFKNCVLLAFLELHVNLQVDVVANTKSHQIIQAID